MLPSPSCNPMDHGPFPGHVHIKYPTAPPTRHVPSPKPLSLLGNPSPGVAGWGGVGGAGGVDGSVSPSGGPWTLLSSLVGVSWEGRLGKGRGGRREGTDHHSPPKVLPLPPGQQYHRLPPLQRCRGSPTSNCKNPRGGWSLRWILGPKVLTLILEPRPRPTLLIATQNA